MSQLMAFIKKKIIFSGKPDALPATPQSEFLRIPLEYIKFNTSQVELYASSCTQSEKFLMLQSIVRYAYVTEFLGNSIQWASDRNLLQLGPLLVSEISFATAPEDGACAGARFCRRHTTNNRPPNRLHSQS